MARQVSTIGGIQVIADDAAPTVPLTSFDGTLGTLIAHNAAKQASTGVGVFNVRDYGAKANGTDDDRAAIASAVAAAIAAGGGTVYLPAGTYRLDYTADTADRITLSGKIAIIGAGPGLTVLDSYPKEIGAFGYYLFNYAATDGELRFEGFRWSGPTTYTAEFAEDVPSGGLLNHAPASGAGTSHRLLARDLELIAPASREGFFTSGGGGHMQYERCRCETLGTCITGYDSAGDKVRSVHIHDCDLKSGVAAGHANGDDFGISVYLHPHVSCLVTGTTFRDNPRGAIKQYGESANVTDKVPKYSIYRDCLFLNNTGGTIDTPSTNGANCPPTIIQGCVFHGGTSRTRTATIYSGCSFHDAGIGETSGARQAEYTVRVTGCHFDGACSVATSAGSTLELSGSTVRLSGTSTGAFLTQNSQSIRIRGCRFVSAISPPTVSTLLLSPSEGQTVEISGCSASGEFVQGLIQINGADRNFTILLRDNDFQGISNGRAVYFNGGTTPGVLRGTGNLFAVGTGSAQGHANSTAPARQSLALPRAANPAGIASAATVHLDLNFDTHRLTGSEAIAAINLGAAGSSQARYDGAILRLIVATGGAWSLADTGNIAPKVTTARTAGDVIVLLYDAVATKWREV